MEVPAAAAAPRCPLLMQLLPPDCFSLFQEMVLVLHSWLLSKEQRTKLGGGSSGDDWRSAAARRSQLEEASSNEGVSKRVRECSLQVQRGGQMAPVSQLSTARKEMTRMMFRK